MTNVVGMIKTKIRKNKVEEDPRANVVGMIKRKISKGTNHWKTQ